MVKYFKRQLLEISSSNSKLFFVLRSADHKKVEFLSIRLNEISTCSKYRFDRFNGNIPIFWEV